MALTQVDGGLIASGAALSNIGAGNITPTYLSTQSQYTGFKNRIINGAMVIDQRNAGASVTVSTSTSYTIDRWKVQASADFKFTIQQNAGSVTPPNGFTNYLGCTSSSAYSIGSGDYFTVTQAIEGFNIADLGWGTANAQTITLSFWVRSSLTGTFGGSLRSSSNNYSYPFSYTISSANTWEQKSITITGPTTSTWYTNNGQGILLNFGLGVGSTYSGTAGSWAASNYLSATGATSVVGTNGATWYITGVQVEKGSTATSFDYRPFGTELALCQRYFEKSFDYATAPANGPNTSSFSTVYGYWAGYTTNAYATGWLPWLVLKRATPTVTPYGNSQGYWQTNGTFAANGLGGVPNQRGYSVTQQSVGGYAATIGHWTAESEL